MTLAIGKLELINIQQLEQISECVEFNNAIKEETTQDIQVNNIYISIIKA